MWKYKKWINEMHKATILTLWPCGVEKDEQLWWRSAESSRTYSFETQMCSWVPRSTQALPEPVSLSLLKRPSHVMCYFNGCSHRLASVASWGARNGRFITLIVHRGHDGPIRADCRCAKVTHWEICQHNGCLLSPSAAIWLLSPTGPPWPLTVFRNYWQMLTCDLCYPRRAEP